VCAYHCAKQLLSCTTRHRTVLIISPVTVQTIIIAQMTSTGGDGSNVSHLYTLSVPERMVHRSVGVMVLGRHEQFLGLSTVKAKFHYTILVADKSEVGRRPASLLLAS